MSFLTRYKSEAEDSRNRTAVMVAADIIALEKQVIAAHDRIEELIADNDKMKSVIGKMESDMEAITKRIDVAAKRIVKLEKENNDGV